MFSKWLLQQVDRDDPIGDLACDYRNDRAWGAGDYRSPKELLSRMLELHGGHLDPDVLQAFKDARREFNGRNRNT